MFTCSKCHLGVIIIQDRPPIKACFCDAPIVANLSATLVGVGGVK